MSSIDENLFGRIAVLNNYLRRDQLDECLAMQRTQSPQRNIGDILLEKGYLTTQQLAMILEIRRKKTRKGQRNPEEVREGDRTFGSLAVGMGLIVTNDLEDAILEQQRLETLNLHFRLGEILVARAKLRPAEVMEVLRRQGKCVLACFLCDTHYNVLKYHSDTTYRCVRCGSELVRPRYLDTFAVDAVIEG